MNGQHTRQTPNGMHPSVELGAMPEDGAIYVKGFLPARYGELNTSHIWRTTTPCPEDIRGMATYSHKITGQRLVTLSHNSSWYTSRVDVYHSTTTRELTVELSDWTRILDFVGPVLREHTDSAVAMYGQGGLSCVQVDDELFVVPVTGGRPRRFLCTNKRMAVELVGLPNSWMGIPFYTTDLVFFLETPSPGPLDAGTYYYAFVPFDEKMRQGQPLYLAGNNEPWTIEITDGNKSVYIITKEWPFPLKAKYVALARAVQGTRDFYIVSDIVETSGSKILIDQVAEADLPLRTPVTPEYECSPPPFARYLTYHHGRLWVADATYGSLPDLKTPDFRDAASMRRVWWSSGAAATHFGTTGADAGYIEFDIPHGDRIVAMAPVGDDLLVLSEQFTFVILGRTPNEFAVRRLGEVGCVAPLTLQVVSGRPYWLSHSGVMTLSETGHPMPISLPVDVLLSGPWAGYPGAID